MPVAVGANGVRGLSPRMASNYAAFGLVASARIKAPKGVLMRPEAGDSVSPSRFNQRFLSVSPPPLNVLETF